MSVSFEISASSGSYTVIVSPGCFRSLEDQAQGDTVFICDERFVPQLTQAQLRTIGLPADEKAKSLDFIPEIISELRKHGAGRGTHLTAIGGGIVQDIAAFCASIYMRGIQWSYMPSTLLGMADSCIGGKSSINVNEYKNIVGTFYPPQVVKIDPELTRTLSREQIVAGLCEAAKICFCRGPDAFHHYSELCPRIDMDEGSLTEVITLSLQCKKWFIEADEFDRGERLLLNFGHTFGHAIEGATKYKVGHGVAVGVGILMELALGRSLGFDYTGLDQVQFLKAHVRELLSYVPSLRATLQSASQEDLLDRFAADKKHNRDVYNVVTVNDAGRTILQPLSRTSQNTQVIRSAIQGVLGEF